MPDDIQPITIRINGGMNNNHIPLDLYRRGAGELVSLINADLTTYGRIKPLFRLAALNSVAEGSSIHSVFRANDVIFSGAGTVLKYRVSTWLISILTGLASASISFAHVGDWIYMCNGTDKKAIYLSPADVDIVKAATYKWTASGSGTSEYYLELLAGGNPGLNEPSSIDETGVGNMTKGTLGSLTASKYGYGDNDSLGYNTIYVRIANSADPDSKADSYLTASFLAEGTDWGQAIPAAAPTVATGAAGNPDGTYSCYYRYKITLPDNSVVYTGLSSAGSVTVSSQKIAWSNITHSTFVGAKTIQAELFRTKTGFSATYLVTTLTSGTTTYTDDVSDATLQTQTAFAETGYYPPPSAPDIVLYNPSCDRVFVAVNNDIYWSQSGGLYHTFIYDSDAGEYTNVNSVFPLNENVTGLEMLDEQMYVGSKKGWIRLRGKDPTTWAWETTEAKKGPVSWRAVTRTKWGLIYPANDGRLWLFNGFDASAFLETFVFSTAPTSTCHATFDGRFYRLFYGDSTHPELIVDFYGYPNTQPRVVKSTRSASASFYDYDSNEFYTGDSTGYLRNGNDTTQNVAISLETPEIPAADLTKLGTMKKLVLRVNTQSGNLTITPKFDGTAQSALTAISNAAAAFESVPLSLGTYFVISFTLSITTTSAVTIDDPLMITQED